MVHTAVVLPQDLLGRLKADAQSAGQGLSTEIRQRLQLSYLAHSAPGDPQTGSFLAAVRHLAHTLGRDIGVKWYEHPYALAAFQAGVIEFLARFQPDGEGHIRPDAPISAGPSDPAEVVGRTHARVIGILGHETEESYDAINNYDETDPDVPRARPAASKRKKSKD
jgi:hypothetical protein